MKTKTMKTALPVLFMVITCLQAFAQGKVTLANDVNHLVVFATNAALLPARYAPYAGQPVPQLETSNDQFQYFTGQWLAGLSPTELTLRYTASPAGNVGMADGRMLSVSYTLPDIAGVATAYFQYLIWETAGGSYENAAVRGKTEVFQATVGGFAPIPLASSPYWVGHIVLASVQQTPEALPPTPSAPQRVGNQIRFSFLAQVGRTYTVESCNSLAASYWTTLTNVPAQAADTTILISDTITATNCYYRVRTP